jgi:hypothetical protein
MTDIKGPAIDSKAFRAEGQCCGIRIPALMDFDSESAGFEISPEITVEPLRAEPQSAEAPLVLPKEDDLTEPRRTPR